MIHNATIEDAAAMVESGRRAHLANTDSKVTIQLVVGRDEEIARWVRHQLPEHPDFGPCTAIGVTEDNRLIAGAVYHNFHDHQGHKFVEVSVIATEPRCCNRRVLRALFRYPFEQLRVRRLQTTVAKRNKRARRLVMRLGFRYEGTGREAWFSGGDACIYSMLPQECGWLKENNIGKVFESERAGAC